MDEIATRHGVEVVHGESIQEVIARDGVPVGVITRVVASAGALDGRDVGVRDQMRVLIPERPARSLAHGADADHGRGRGAHRSPAT